MQICIACMYACSNAHQILVCLVEMTLIRMYTKSRTSILIHGPGNKDVELKQRIWVPWWNKNHMSWHSFARWLCTHPSRSNLEECTISEGECISQKMSSRNIANSSVVCSSRILGSLFSKRCSLPSHWAASGNEATANCDQLHFHI